MKKKNLLVFVSFFNYFPPLVVFPTHKKNLMRKKKSCEKAGFYFC